MENKCFWSSEVACKIFGVLKYSWCKQAYWLLDAFLYIVVFSRSTCSSRRTILTLGLIVDDVGVTEAQRLVISPRGTQIKTVHTGAIFTCSIVDYEQPEDWTTVPSMRWLGPGLVPVTATRGRSVSYGRLLVIILGINHSGTATKC